MACAETLNTQAFLDGEVTGEAADAAERHIAGCAECQAFCADAAALSDDIRRLAPRHIAPESLRERVAAALTEETQRQARVRDAATKAARRGFWQGLFSGAGVSGVAAALVVVAILPPSPARLADKLTEAHTGALMAGRAIQVVSSDHHTVKPWFAGRIALSPPVTDFAAQGFTLTGGRLDKVAGQPAAVVVYQHGRHEIDLFVWADRGGALPPSALSHGYHLLFWRSGDLDFGAVSDVQASELARFSALVRAQPE